MINESKTKLRLFQCVRGLVDSANPLLPLAGSKTHPSHQMKMQQKAPSLVLIKFKR